MGPALLPPDHPDAPKFWSNESTGVLQPVVLAYLRGRRLNYQEIAIMRAYLRQWIMSPVWAGFEVDLLRKALDFIDDYDSLRRWIDSATDEGIDPL